MYRVKLSVLLGLTFSAPATDSIVALCSATARSPICEIYLQCNTNPTEICDVSMAENVLSALCSVDFKTRPECSLIQQNTPTGSFLKSIPSAKVASDGIYSICFEMPFMTGCSQCPPPTEASGGVSDCPVLQVFGDLCMEMPGMYQCGVMNEFCLTAPDVLPCGGKAGSSNMTTGSAPGFKREYCDKNSNVCFAGYPGRVSGETCFDVFSKMNGWVGLGIGTSIMRGADIYMAFGQDQQLRIGNFQAASEVQPSARLNQSAITFATLINKDEAHPWSTFSFSFCRTNKVSKIRVTPSISYIYAWEPTKPTGNQIADDSLAIGKNGTMQANYFDSLIYPFHTGGYDTFNKDFSSLSSTAVTASNKNTAKRSVSSLWISLLGFVLLC